MREECGFDEVRVFAGTSEEARARKSEGEATFKSIMDVASDMRIVTNSDDLIVFAFMGHGQNMRLAAGNPKTFVLIPSDANIRYKQCLVPVKELTETLDQAAAKHKVLLLDCCRDEPEAARGDASAEFDEAALTRNIKAGIGQQIDNGKSTLAMLTACKAGQRAYASDTYRHGFLTKCLIDGIKEQAKSGPVILNPLVNYVQDEVPKHNEKQHPYFKQHGSADLIHLKPPPARPTPPPPPKSLPETDWCVLGPDRTNTYYSEQELQNLIATKAISAKTLVWRVGWADWAPLESCAQWASHFAPPAPPKTPKANPKPPKTKEPHQLASQDHDFNLLQAAYSGDAARVELLLNQGVNPDILDSKNGNFPLLLAAQVGHAETLKILLERGAEPNKINSETGSIPLNVAAQNGHAETVKILLERGAEPNKVNPKTGNLPLILAAENGRTETVKILLERGAEPNKVNPQHGTLPLILAAQNGHAETVKILLERGAEPNKVNPKTGNLPLILAAENGHAETVKILLERGAEPNKVNPKTGNFPLSLAAGNGRSETVKILLERGAEPNKVNPQNGTLPLILAAQNGHAETVKILLERGAEPNKVNPKTGNFPLILAADNGRTETVKILLERGAEPNKVNPQNGTLPLILAAQNGHAETVKILLERGAEPNKVNPKTGNFPLILAADNGRTETVKILLERGAEPNKVSPQTERFPLLQAVLNGHLAVVETLLNKGADLEKASSKTGEFPLLLAAQNGHSKVVDLLLERGVDPNSVNRKNGVQPLLMAAQNGHIDVVQKLLDRGAKARVATRNGWSPLKAAQSQNYQLIVEALVKAGALGPAKPATDSSPRQPLKPIATSPKRWTRGLIGMGLAVLLVCSAIILLGRVGQTTSQSLEPGQRFRDFADAPEMIVLPTGNFMMGSPDDELERYFDEGPQREITFSEPFALSVYEVTFDQWDACVDEGGCVHRPNDRGWGRGNRPVIDVSWEDAQDYVAWMNRKTEGGGYALPSEAQWEYAARAGTITPFHTGDQITADQANFNGIYTYNGSEEGEYRRQTVPAGESHLKKIHHIERTFEEQIAGFCPYFT